MTPDRKLARSVLTLAAGLAVALGAPAFGADGATPHLDLTAAQWHEDLAALAHGLPQGGVSNDQVAALDSRLDRADGDEAFVGLQAIAASAGATLVEPADRQDMPFVFARFGSAIRVVAAGPGLEDTLGARVTRVGTAPISDVWSRLLALTPQGAPESVRNARALAYLARGYVLHGLDVTSDRSHALYSFARDDGKTLGFNVKGAGPGEARPLKPGYSQAALRFQQSDAAFGCKPVPDHSALYCAWRGDDALDANAKAMFAQIDQTHPAKLVLDMRDYRGDGTSGAAALVEAIKARADLNAKGHLYVLVGSESPAGVMAFRDETAATLCGETVSVAPGASADASTLRLPNGDLTVRLAASGHAAVETVHPAQEIAASWSDMKAGRDPALDWVLAQ